MAQIPNYECNWWHNVHNMFSSVRAFWIPAFAGMTFLWVSCAQAQPITPVQNLSPSQGNVAETTATPGTISLDEAVKRKPVRFIEVDDLPPPAAEDINPEDLVDPNSKPADEGFTPSSLKQTEFRTIHKLTGRAETLSGNVGDVLRFGDMEMVVHKCSSVMDQGERGVAALIEVTEFSSSGAENTVFRGWLFSTSPSLSSIQHPQYDVLIQSCGA